VKVSDEVFGTLRKMKDGFEVDYLRTAGLNGREALGEQFQIIKVTFHINDGQ